MNKKIRKSFYLLTIIAVLSMSFMPTYTVFADGGAGEDPPSADPPAEEPADDPAGEPVIEEPTTEVPPEVPAEVSTEGSPPEEPVSVPEILEQVPEGTDLVVINQEGDSEPLASEVAADTLIEGDPVWCPAGQAPTPGANGCTSGHTGFDDLIVDLTSGAYNGDGVIWVESSYDATQDAGTIAFDGSVLNTLNAISINGGWNGVSGSTSLDPTNPSLLDDPLSIVNWTGAISLANLTFQDALSPFGSINVETDGDITLTNIDEAGNTGSSGVNLDNCNPSGGVCTTGGEITVSESSFADNHGDGLYAISSDDVTVKDVTSELNTNDGIHVLTEGSVIVKNSTVDQNGYEGLESPYVAGNVTLSNLTSTDNGDGILFDYTYGDFSASNITSTGNTNDGVQVDNTNGKVTLSNITVETNGDNGVEIFNANGGALLACITAANNGADGINVSSTDNVTVKCSQISDNSDDGVDIDLAVTAQLLSVTSTGNTDLDIEIDPATTVTEKEIDCSGKEKPSTGKKEPWTKLYCLPSEIKVALFDTYGDMVEFENLCGYDAGVFDPDSWILPEEIPGGGEEYILSLQEKMVEEIPNIEPITKYGLPGIIAQVLDELPFMLPDGFSYRSAFFTAVMNEGEYQDPLPDEAGLTVRFRVPESLDPDEGLTILWWDGVEWVDMGGDYSEDGYYFQLTTEETGVFVLAKFNIEN